MTSYVLSILGIVVAGVFIDIIIPSGAISKYIKGIYAIFVVAVLISPVVKFLNKNHNFTIKYQEYNLNENLLNYIHTSRANEMEKTIENCLYNTGFSNVKINLKISTENNELKYYSCVVNIKNLVISSDKQHINKYEHIKEVVKDYTGLSLEEIIIDEW